MGINYYWIDESDCEKFKEEPCLYYDIPIKYHIGKKSNAGYYCYDCGISRHENTAYVHSARNDYIKFGNCPGCEKEFTECTYSFTWTMMKQKKKIEDYIAKNDHSKHIVNEEGVQISCQEFMEIYKKCKIDFQCCTNFF